MGLGVGYPPNMEELYRQLSSSPAFARMMQGMDAKQGGGDDPNSWLQGRLRTQGLNIPPMPPAAPQQMAPQAMQAPQMPPQAPMPMGLPSMPQAQNRQSGGFLSGLIPEGGEFKARLGDMLMGMGTGANINDSFAQGGRAMMEGRRAREPLRAQAAELNRTRQYAMQQGMPPDVAMTLDGPSIMKWVLDRNKPADPMDALTRKKAELEIGNLENPKPDKPITVVSPDGKQKRSINPSSPNAAAILQRYFDQGWVDADEASIGGNPTDDMREYEAAKQQGFTGTFMDFIRETKKPLVSIDNSTKLPTGYMWADPADPAKGVKTLPGGPAEQLPAELAARIGVADSFIGQIPEIRKAVEAGDVTGPVDSISGSMGIGNAGWVRRKIDSGADVLQRFLTGAGMPASEAEEYARRYKPQMQDTSAVVLDKLNQLERELKSAKDMAMKGRGGTPSAPNPSTGGLPEGVTQEEWDAMTPEERALWN